MAQRLDHESLNRRLKAIESIIDYRDRWGEFYRLEDAIEELCRLIAKSKSVSDSTPVATRLDEARRMSALCDALLTCSRPDKHHLLVEKALAAIEKVINDIEDWQRITSRTKDVKAQ